MAFHSTEQMSEYDTIYAFCDGANKAISAARELARDSGNSSWEQIAHILTGMRDNGYRLAHMKDMTKSERENALALKSGLIIPS